MSRYLEEAARLLRKAEETAMGVEACTKVAKGFATLAAIDKGLLPAEITQDVIRAIVDRTTA